jgi:hypothetical protein
VIGPPLSEIPKRRPPAFEKISTSLGDATQELGVMLETIVEPVVIRSKPDQHAGRPPVARDDDLLVNRQPEVLRQIILDLRESDRSWRCP